MLFSSVPLLRRLPLQHHQTYLRRHREYIFKSSANIFLNVLQMYFCKVFLFMICALQLQNLKSNAKMGIDDTNYLILNSFHCTVFIFHSIVTFPSIFDSVSLSEKVACICSPGKRFLFYIQSTRLLDQRGNKKCCQFSERKW